jgi:hypothetical protein
LELNVGPVDNIVWPLMPPRARPDEIDTTPEGPATEAPL